MDNSEILELVVELTAAKMSNTTLSPCKETGQNVAEFMEVLYDKLTELNGKDQVINL